MAVDHRANGAHQPLGVDRLRDAIAETRRR